MKSFLVRNKVPIIMWSRLPDNTFFEGQVPEGFSLAIVPSGLYIVLDVDKHKNVSGFDNLPDNLIGELSATLSYPTKNNGRHFWFKYTGTEQLANKASGLGIDLRVGNKGYVVWYPNKDIREYLGDIKETSPRANKWLEELFTFK